MAVDEISSNERVGSPDVKSLMCIIHFQHGGPKAVNTVDEVGGGGGEGDLHSILITVVCLLYEKLSWPPNHDWLCLSA